MDLKMFLKRCIFSILSWSFRAFVVLHYRIWNDLQHIHVPVVRARVRMNIYMNLFIDYCW